MIMIHRVTIFSEVKGQVSQATGSGGGPHMARSDHSLSRFPHSVAVFGSPHL
jgi:hypothetical protein